jgi:hypothetical protein
MTCRSIRLGCLGEGRQLLKVLLVASGRNMGEEATEVQWLGNRGEEDDSCLAFGAWCVCSQEKKHGRLICRGGKDCLLSCCCLDWK